jgi:hypothetical protein
MYSLPTRSLILGTILSLLPAGAAAANCSNADFFGRYGFMVQGQILQDGPRDIRPEWIAGTVYADGYGVITEWLDTDVRAPDSGGSQQVQQRDVVAFATANGGSITYEVSPDCRMVLRADLVVALIEVHGVLMQGGQEFRGVQTSPEGFMGGGVFKSMDPPGAVLETKIDRLLNRFGLPRDPRSTLRP